VNSITDSSAWGSLQIHWSTLKNLHMRELFAKDSDRFSRFSLQVDDFFLDFSKNRITTQTLELLLQLAQEVGLSQEIHRMFEGEKINFTEHRAVLHTALRNRSGEPVCVDNENVMPEVHGVLERMGVFATKVRSGEWQGYSAKRITDVVNIGIGGSDLGPKMVTEALRPFSSGDLNMHFVSNVDGADLGAVLQRLDPETSLFIVTSKTFTTQETMANANSARQWFLSHHNEESALARHFVAVSTNLDATAEFGIDSDNVFGFWDWVGGRYSLWSAVGLSIMISIGEQHFRELLDGAWQMDQHFRSAPFSENMPVILGLLGVWYINFFGAETHGIFPYNQSLHRFAAYMQQCDMESNGKRINKQGSEVDYETGPIVWGEPGTNGQHAFFQLVHQSDRLIPCDFIMPIHSQYPLEGHNDYLTANFLAQTEALMKGKTEAEARAELESKGMSTEQIDALSPHKIFPGNKPSNSLLFPALTPQALGKLVALYEHKIFVQGVLWGINSFDQWGVELGKQLASNVLEELKSGKVTKEHDASTAGLLNYIFDNR